MLQRLCFHLDVRKPEQPKDPKSVLESLWAMPEGWELLAMAEHSRYSYSGFNAKGASSGQVQEGHATDAHSDSWPGVKPGSLSLLPSNMQKFCESPSHSPSSSPSPALPYPRQPQAPPRPNLYWSQFSAHTLSSLFFIGGLYHITVTFLRCIPPRSTMLRVIECCHWTVKTPLRKLKSCLLPGGGDAHL